MDGRLCELVKIVCNTTKMSEEVNEQKDVAGREIDLLLRQECKAYDDICNKIIDEKKSGLMYNYYYVQGLKDSKNYLREWLLEDVCKE